MAVINGVEGTGKARSGSAGTGDVLQDGDSDVVAV